ncbi:MAG TPA: biotin--[acetyl-CoA-carboxylase] ligase [Flavisolibacter sp.]|nr:biotin--[acetyl-CoA-carboxylase] ligase [Flavisolibacter sp.]
MSSLKPIGSPFIELPSVDSTNNYAMGLVHAGMARHGTAVFAHEQTKGKGQQNKQWLSQKDKNIALSLIIEPIPLLLPDLFLLSMTVAIATRSFFDKQTKGEVKIKWPNDIYWRDRKAGGILIENVITGNTWKYAVAGIGLNINQTDFNELQSKAVSLEQITGKTYQPLSLAKDLCRFLDLSFQLLLKKPSEIIEEYKEHLYKLNEPVKLKKTNRIFEAVIKDVTTSGQLVVMHALEETFSVGEVEWII